MGFIGSIGGGPVRLLRQGSPTPALQHWVLT
jgi:hypothetical protein